MLLRIRRVDGALHAGGKRPGAWVFLKPRRASRRSSDHQESDSSVLHVRDCCGHHFGDGRHSARDDHAESHAIDDLGIDSLAFLDIAFAIDKAFGIKLPLEQWTQEVNEGKVPAEEYFVLKNLVARVDDLVAAKSAAPSAAS